MFVCQMCACVVGPRIPVTRVAVKRYKTYPYREKANRKIKVISKEYLKSLGTVAYWYLKKDDPGGEGWELERELLVCKKCGGK